MKLLKINLELIIKIIVITFIAVTLIAVSVELFSDLTKLNRAF